MRRGTTPTHIFKSDVDLTDAVEIFMTYKQSGKIYIEKTIEDMEVSQDEIRIKLSQTDTLALSTMEYVEIQCRAKFPDGAAIASNIINAPVQKILKEGVI